jgi:hypothetical protein
MFHQNNHNDHLDGPVKLTEHFWDKLDRRVRPRLCSDCNLVDLKRFLKHEWNAIQQHETYVPDMHHCQWTPPDTELVIVLLKAINTELNTNLCTYIFGLIVKWTACGYNYVGGIMREVMYTFQFHARYP